ncbi:hypothetical protein GCM10023221_23410 [Luteimicrobium xylanilyticum]
MVAAEQGGYGDRERRDHQHDDGADEEGTAATGPAALLGASGGLGTAHRCGAWCARDVRRRRPLPARRGHGVDGTERAWDPLFLPW